MFFPDRFWWLLVLGGALVASVSLITLGASLVIILQIGFAGIDFPWVGLMGWVFLVAISFFFFRHAFRSRERFRCRIRAMQGEQQSMQRAAILTDPNLAPSLTSESIEILWRATPVGRRFALLGASLLFLLFSGVFVLGVHLFVLAFTRPLDEGVAAVLQLLIAGGVIVLPLGGMAYYIPKLLAYRGSPNGLVARLSGLLYYPKVGHSQVLRWEDIRLFEVAFDNVQGNRIYRLFGTNTIAQWSDGVRPKIASWDVPEQEFLERHQALLNLILEQTHLLPRTFDKRLITEDESAHQSRNN